MTGSAHPRAYSPLPRHRFGCSSSDTKHKVLPCDPTTANRSQHQSTSLLGSDCVWSATWNSSTALSPVFYTLVPFSHFSTFLSLFLFSGSLSSLSCKLNFLFHLLIDRLAPYTCASFLKVTRAVFFCLFLTCPFPSPWLYLISPRYNPKTMKLHLAPIISTLLYTATALERCDHGNECTDPDVIKLNTTTCSIYHIFTARGSNAKKPGHAGELIRQICTELGNCNFEDIDFPARGGGNGWCESAHTGAVNGVAQLRNYTERCPDSNLIVVGFSQGAGVSLDYLGGGGDVHVFGCNQSSNTGLSRSSVPGSKGRLPSKSPFMQTPYIDLSQLSQPSSLAPPSAPQEPPTPSAADATSTAQPHAPPDSKTIYPLMQTTEFFANTAMRVTLSAQLALNQAT